MPHQVAKSLKYSSNNQDETNGKTPVCDILFGKILQKQEEMDEDRRMLSGTNTKEVKEPNSILTQILKDYAKST